jgi:hypothetical protein
MTLRKDWLNRQFERVDADVRNWPISMKVEAGFATREQAEPGLSCAPNEKSATVEIAPKGPVKNRTNEP